MEEYKTGVYRIFNNITGLAYIGSAAKSFRVRWGNHKRALRKEEHDNKHLQRSWSLHGEESFTFEILEICDPSQCIEREEFYIQQYDFSMLYNQQPHAGSNLGFKCSDETKKKMSEAQLGKRHTDDAKKKMSIAKTGHFTSEEHKAKISAKNKGRKKPPGFGENISRLKTGNKYCLGKECSQETRNKIGEANRGRIYTEETRRKMSANCTTKIPIVATVVATGEEIQFESIGYCSDVLGIPMTTLNCAIKGNFLCRKKWRFKKLLNPSQAEHEVQPESEESPHPTCSDTEQ